jgi:hypothetical protein
MGERAGAITRALAVALVVAAAWGLAVALLFGGPPLRGALVGLYLWGPAIVLSARWRDSAEATPPDAFLP